MIFLSIPSAVAMLLAWSVPGMAMAGSAVASIEVFTDVDHPVTASPAFRERVGSSTVVQVFRIDAQARLDRFLSRDLPPIRTRPGPWRPGASKVSTGPGSRKS